MNFKDQRQQDLAVFTNVDEYGSVVILSHNGVDTEINAVVRDAPSSLKDIERIDKFISIKLSDAPYLDKGAQFIIDGETYRIVSIPENYGEDLYPKIFITKVDK